MPHLRTACAGLTVSLLVFGGACSRRAPESRIRSVEARIQGITCPSCVPPLTASLKREYEKSTIEVDDDKDTATIHFAEGDHFSAPAFHAAVERVLRMRVVTLRLQACGTIAASKGDAWLTVGTDRFQVHSDRALPPDGPVCVDGTLDSRSDPATLQVSAFSAQDAPGF